MNFQPTEEQEAVQRTAREAFWPTVRHKDPDLEARNTRRPHGSLGGNTPSTRLKELASKIPALEVVQAACDPGKESLRSPNTRYRRVATSAPVT